MSLPSPLDADAFRSVLGRFATGVTVVTTCDASGVDHGMTVSAFCSLSLDPPLVLFCVDRSAAMHGVLQNAGHFAVNILASHQEALSRRFSDFDDHRRFDGIGYSRSQAGDPLLEDVLAWMECELVRRDDGGDHGIYIGNVVRAEVRETRPLLYYRGGYAQLER